MNNLIEIRRENRFEKYLFPKYYVRNLIAAPSVVMPTRIQAPIRFANGYSTDKCCPLFIELKYEVEIQRRNAAIDWTGFLVMQHHVIYAEIDVKSLPSAAEYLPYITQAISSKLNLKRIGESGVILRDIAVWRYLTSPTSTSSHHCFVFIAPVVNLSAIFSGRGETLMKTFQANITIEQAIRVNLDALKESPVLLVAENYTQMTQTFFLANLMRRIGVRFEQMIYPSANSASQRQHFVRNLLNFLKNCQNYTANRRYCGDSARAT